MVGGKRQFNAFAVPAFHFGCRRISCWLTPGDLAPFAFRAHFRVASVLSGDRFSTTASEQCGSGTGRPAREEPFDCAAGEAAWPGALSGLAKGGFALTLVTDASRVRLLGPTGPPIQQVPFSSQLLREIFVWLRLLSMCGPPAIGTNQLPGRGSTGTRPAECETREHWVLTKQGLRRVDFEGAEIGTTVPSH